MTANPRWIARSRLLGTVLLCLVAACAAPSAPQQMSESHDSELGELMLAALDGEGLYTVCGGIKPVSSSYWRHKLEVGDPASAVEAIEATRKRLALLGRLSPQDAEGRPLLWWGVLPFAKPYEGERSLHAYVVHRPSLAELLERRADVFAPLGLTPSSEPAEVLAITERLPRSDRYRAYGLLFGYPEDAVEFFVTADQSRGEGEEIVPRDFRQIPTVSGDRGKFVYAVPKGAPITPSEKALRTRCEELLERYRPARSDWVEGSCGEEDIRALLQKATSGFGQSPSPLAFDFEQRSSRPATTPDSADHGRSIELVHAPALR